jgi:hypothetical protein
MLKKQLIISLFVVFLVVGLSGTVFAFEPGSEAGVELVSSQKAMAAAENYNYNQQQLDAVGTEAGAWKLNSNATQSKADVAAAQHEYDQRRLDLIGTEAGADRMQSSRVCPC